MSDQINDGGDNRKPEHSAEAKREFALVAIRTASFRARQQATEAQIFASEIEEIGVSLRHNMIDAEFAVGWMDYIGALPFANVEPFANKFEMEAA